MTETKKEELNGASNWAEAVDEDDEDADAAIGSNATTAAPEEAKKEVEPEKVYNLPERRRNKYGDFVVTTVKVKEKVTATVEENADGSDDEDESSEEEEEDQLKEIVKEEEKKEPVKLISKKE
jgi:hypothetical protein